MSAPLIPPMVLPVVAISARPWLPRAAFQTLLLVAVLLVRTGLAAGFAPIDDITRDEDSGAVDVPVEFDPSPWLASAYTLEAESTNVVLLPPGSLTLLGSAPRVTLRIRTAPEAFGEAEIRLRARSSEPGATTFIATFRLLVLAVDDPPRIQPVPNQVMVEGTPFLRVPIEASDPDSSFRLSVDSGNSPWFRASVEGSGGRQFVTLRPTSVRPTSTTRTTITVAAASGNKSSTVQFYVTLLLRDFQPSNRLSGVPQWAGLPPNTPTGSAQVTWVDVNRDGYPDAVLPTSRQILLNPTTAVASSPLVRLGNANGSGYLGTAWTDLDGDGDLDVCAWNAGTLDVLRTMIVQGRPNFTNISRLQPTLATAGAAFLDLDGNGTQDLVYTGVTNETRKVITALNDGEGTLTEVSNTLPGFAGPVVAADFNRDGRTDLLLSEGSRRGTAAQIFYRQEGVSFIAGPTVSEFDPVTSAGALDFNADGLMDLWLVEAVQGNMSALELRILVQDQGQFTEILHIPSDEFRGLGAPSWGDFDQDGLVDFIAPSDHPLVLLNGTTGSTNQVMLYHNQGGGRFEPDRFLFFMPSPALPHSTAANRFAPNAADLDLDGDLDFVGYDAGIRPFYNQLRNPNLPPDAPEGLRGVILGDELFLFWNGSRDPNQDAPLSYNVRVGTSPGGNELLSSHSRFDGTRMVQDIGNAGYAYSFRLRITRRDSDSVFCSVQAVDASFTGSPFAPELRLALDSVGNQPPEIESPLEVILDEDSEATVSLHLSDDRTRNVDLVVSAEVDAPDLFADRNLPVFPVIQPVNAFQRYVVVVLRPLENRSGEATLRVTARDRNWATTTRDLRVVVRPVNDAPNLTVQLPTLHRLGAAATGTITVSDLESPAESLRVSLQSSNPDLLPVDRVELSGTGSERTLVARPAGSGPGSAVLTLQVTDPDGVTSVANATLTWQDQLLEPDPTFSWAANLRQANWVDLNADGRLDVVGHRDSGIVEVWTQDDQNRFARSSASSTGRDNDELLFGDLDGDGDVDILAAQFSGTDFPGNLFLLRNDAGVLAAPLSLNPPAGLASVVLLDADSDGDPDVVVGLADIQIRIAWNSPGTLVGSVPPGWAPFPALNPELILFTPLLQVGDVNHDGRSDLFVSRPGGTGPVLHRILGQREDGKFQLYQSQWGEDTQLVGFADFDNQGRNESLLRILAGWQLSPMRLAGNPLLGFYPTRLPMNMSSPPLGDLDNDGFVDVLGVLQTPPEGAEYGLVSDLLGNRVFRAQRPATYRLDHTSSGDHDRDGILELWVPVDGGSQLLRLSGVRSNRPPSAPTGLQMRQVTDGVGELSWSASSDPEQTGGLTYMVRIGTRPGTGDVVSALARADGTGLLPVPGNAGGRTRFLLRGLQLGHPYYASVQAIDAGFARSPFAPEVSLTVDSLPVISPIPNIMLPLNAPTRRIAFTVTDAETPGDQLGLTVESSNPVLLPASRVRLSGTGTERELLLDPKPDRSGSCTLRLRLTDRAANTVEHSFEVYVNTTTPYAVEARWTLAVAADRETKLRLDEFDPDGDFREYTVVAGPDHGRWEQNGPEITYHPNPGFLGEDVVSFLASTPGSFPASGQVTLQVLPGYRLQPEVRWVRLGQDLRPRLAIRGRSGTAIRLEHSTDLMRWESRGDSRFPESEILILDTEDPADSAPHFFRAVPLP